jgi:hypothetical protein
MYLRWHSILHVSRGFDVRCDGDQPELLGLRVQRQAGWRMAARCSRRRTTSIRRASGSRPVARVCAPCRGMPASSGGRLVTLKAA